MNKKIIQDILLSEDSLQDQLQTNQNMKNLSRESDIHSSLENSDLEKEALDRLKQIRSRISQEEVEYTQQTQTSSEALRSKNEFESQQIQSQRGMLSSQSIQKIPETNQTSKTQGITGNTECTGSQNEQYYFKLPPKSLKNNQQVSQTNGSAEIKSKQRSSIKYEDQNVRIIENSDSSREKQNKLNTINHTNSENNIDSYEYLKKLQSEQNNQKEQKHSNYQKNIQQDNNPYLKSNELKQQQSTQSQKRLSSETPNSKIFNKVKDEQKISKSNQGLLNNEFTTNKKQLGKQEIQVEDKFCKNQKSIPSKKYEQQSTQNCSNNQIKLDNNHNNLEESDSLDVSEIEQIQQKLSERKRSIDHINKLTEKINSPSYSIHGSQQNNKIPLTPQSNFSIQKNTYDGTFQSAGFEQYNQGKSPLNGLPLFPQSNDISPFAAGQQNMPTSPNQFCSTFSSQHRLSAMMNQLTPKQQDKYLPLEKNSQFYFMGKENLANQSPINNNFSSLPNDKQLNFFKKGQQHQNEVSNSKDDTIQEINRKLTAITEQSRQQKDEIHNLREQLYKPKYNMLKKQDSLKQISSQKQQNTQKKQEKSRKNEDRNQTSSLKISSTKEFMQKSTKRDKYEKINVEGESESDNIELDTSDFDDEMSMVEQVLDLKNEINTLKEQIDDKNIELQKQQQMLLEQRNSLNKKEKEVEELRMRLQNFELGYNNVEKEVQLIEKSYQVKKLKDNQSLEKDLYIQYNEELTKENNELLFKAATLLEKYKELEDEYKKVVNENEQQLHWRNVVSQRDQEVFDLKRELEYIKSNQLSELKQYKDVVDRLGTNLETHKTSEIIKKFVDICSENKKHIEFQKQFYDVISSCQDPGSRRSGLIGIKETWDLFKKIFQDYLELRKKDRLDITLGNLLLKGLQITNRDEIVPAFTKKLMENEQYNNIIHKIKYHLNINHNCSLSELSDSIDQLLSKKLYYK